MGLIRLFEHNFLDVTADSQNFIAFESCFNEFKIQNTIPRRCYTGLLCLFAAVHTALVATRLLWF